MPHPKTPPRRKFNTKRALRPPVQTAADQYRLDALAERVAYGGNPQHKRNPGDFGLTPPAAPRQGKTLCDDVAIFKKAEALRLLRCGVRRGLVSEQMNGEWPQNIWAVSAEGIPLEAMYDGNGGCYHGYPMPAGDPLAGEVRLRWDQCRRRS